MTDYVIVITKYNLYNYTQHSTFCKTKMFNIIDL